MNKEIALKSKLIDFLLTTKTISVYQLLTKLYKRSTIKGKVNQYINSLQPGQELKVVFGGHWSNHPGWLILNESDQDITKVLSFSDGIVQAIFTEHVIEHLPFNDAINFCRESHRILKSGGVFRIVCPMLDALNAANLEGENGKYEASILRHTYAQEDQFLRDLGTQGIEDFVKIFLINDVFRNHGHQFIWTADLMVKVLQAVGFSKVQVSKIGEGVKEDYCLERRCRSIYLGYDWREDRQMGLVNDAQSLAIEAIK